MSTSIAPDFKHGSGFTHGENVVIEPDVVVGDNVNLGHFIVLKSGTRFGSNINFADFCCTTGACILGDNINVRTNTVISKGVIAEDDVYIGPGVMSNHTKHITHRRPQIKGQFYVTRICHGAIIGASVWIMAGVTIGKNVIVGGGVLIVKNIMDPGIYVGTPPRILRVLPPEYVVPGSSKEYNFQPEIIEKYLPGIIELPV
jgi:acetyltransferase-like isoleucine patch superfamily enzyme